MRNRLLLLRSISGGIPSTVLAERGGVRCCYPPLRMAAIHRGRVWIQTHETARTTAERYITDVDCGF